MSTEPTITWDDVPGSPVVDIRVTTTGVTVNGVDVDVDGLSEAQWPEAAVKVAAEQVAAPLGRAVRAIARDGEDSVSLIIHPDGTTGGLGAAQPEHTDKPDHTDKPEHTDKSNDVVDQVDDDTPEPSAAEAPAAATAASTAAATAAGSSSSRPARRPAGKSGNRVPKPAGTKPGASRKARASAAARRSGRRRRLVTGTAGVLALGLLFALGYTVLRPSDDGASASDTPSGDPSVPVETVAPTNPGKEPKVRPVKVRVSADTVGGTRQVQVRLSARVPQGKAGIQPAGVQEPAATRLEWVLRGPKGRVFAKKVVKVAPGVKTRFVVRELPAQRYSWQLATTGKETLVGATSGAVTVKAEAKPDPEPIETTPTPTETTPTPTPTPDPVPESTPAAPNPGGNNGNGNGNGNGGNNGNGNGGGGNCIDPQAIC